MFEGKRHFNNDIRKTPTLHDPWKRQVTDPLWSEAWSSSAAVHVFIDKEPSQTHSKAFTLAMDILVFVQKVSSTAHTNKT